ncbi:MAG TPA: hypothetical protein VGI60_01730 [Chthoniobacterales bacterium]|jgi:hypothetical protein
MHHLPFGAQITNDLLDILRDAQARIPREHSDFMVCLGCTSFPEGKPSERWSISAFSRSYMREEDIFTVDEVQFAVSPDDQSRAASYVLDYKEGAGVVPIDNPKI